MKKPSKRPSRPPKSRVSPFRHGAAALAGGESMLQTLVDHLPHGVFVKDRAGCYLTANRAAAQLMGVARPADLLGKTDADFYSPGLAAGYRAVERRILRTGRAVLDQIEPRRNAGGLERYIRTTRVPLKDAQGNIFGLVGISRDITERKRLELELMELNVRLEARITERTALLAQANRQLRLNEFSVQHASLPLCWVGPNGRILRVNHAFADLTGYAQEKAPGLKLFDIAPDFTAAAWPGHWRQLRKGKTLLLDMNVRRKDGKLVPVEANLNHLEFERQEYGFVCLHDVSAPKQVDAERRERARMLAAARDAERARFARDLHDNTAQYLTALKLKIEGMLSQAGLPEGARRHLNQMQELVRKLLADVRQMAWQLHPPVLGDVGLDEALRRACSEWSEENGVKATYQSEGQGRKRLPPHIETTLFRIAQEALTNVARHAAASQVSVLLQQHNHTLSLIVEDNGKGFHVQRALAVALDRHRLGLLGMRERAEQAGGTFNIESRPGQGTTLFVRLTWPGNSASKHARAR